MIKQIVNPWSCSVDPIYIETLEQFSNYYELLNWQYINAKSNYKDSKIISDIILKKQTINSVAYLQLRSKK